VSQISRPFILQHRTAEGKTKKEIIRCLKRAVVREIYTALRADLAPNDSNPAGTKINKPPLDDA